MSKLVKFLILTTVWNMLNLKDVFKTFNKNTINEKIVFEKFSLNVKKGDFITIIGGNGAGKSTLMNVIAGSLSLDEGKIFLEGEDLTNKKEFQRAKKIARVFQDPSKGTCPTMTILENLSMAYNKGKSFGFTKGIQKNQNEFFVELLKMLDLGLENQLNTKVSLLSGGQRQALSLLMSTMKKPSLLLLDEHTSALDPKTAYKIIELTKKIVGEKEITTLMITHNMKQAIELGNRLLMMDQGKIKLDIREGKEKLTTKDLLLAFEKAGAQELNDRMILAG